MNLIGILIGITLSFLVIYLVIKTIKLIDND